MLSIDHKPCGLSGRPRTHAFFFFSVRSVLTFSTVFLFSLSSGHLWAQQGNPAPSGQGGPWEQGINWDEELPGVRGKEGQEGKEPGDEGPRKWSPSWKEKEDPVSELFRKYSDDYAKKIVKLCVDNYELTRRYNNMSLDRIAGQKKEWDEKTYLNEKYEWQTRDRKAKQTRHLNKLKRSAALDMVTRLVHIMKDLDKIKNKDVLQSEEFIGLQGKIIRDYVKAQMYLGNYPQCIPILERYLKLSAANAKEIKAHEYLAACYRFQEKSATKSSADPNKIFFYMERKNYHLQVYTVLKFGKDSPQYREIMEKIERERMEKMPH